MEINTIAILGCIVALVFGLTAVFFGTNEEPEPENTVEESTTWDEVD